VTASTPFPSPDARRILVARTLRGFVDGLVSVLLPDYLMRLGFTAIEVGAIVTGTLLGSAAVTMAVGVGAHRWSRRHVLLVASALMLATGIGFAGLTTFWPLLVVAVVGTLNPSAGDVSVFLPTEQAALAQTAEGQQRTTLFAWHGVGGNLAGALGALASGVPALAARAGGFDVLAAERAGFVVYALVAVATAGLYRGLGRSIETGAASVGAPLARSRRLVIELSALFSLDSFGGGFAVQALLVLWLSERFGFPVGVAGAVFFAAGVLSAFSQLLSARLAARIGLVRTMVWTHLPANVFLVAAGLVPSAPLAVGFLLARAALSQMDVPARQAYVMSVVRPEERAAAASVTNVPRSLASAASPALAGALLQHSSFGWPLVAGGALKIAYDLLLLAGFRHRPPRV